MELFFPLGSDVGDLAILSYLGGHTNSQVFLAQAKNGELFAVKALRPDAFTEVALKAYRDETTLQVSAKVRTCQVSTAHGVVYAVAPYIAGESLAQLLARYPQTHSSLAREVIGQAAEAVDELHARGLVHGALKPGNILLTVDNGRLSVCILDLGSRHLRSYGQEEVTVQFAGSALEYNSPEQADGQTPTSKSDVFTLGVLLFEMLTGSVPFTGGVGYSTRSARQVLELNPDADPELAALADRLLRPHVPGRSNSIADLVRIRDHTTSQPEDDDELTRNVPFIRRAAAPTTNPASPHQASHDGERTVAVPPYVQEASSQGEQEDGGTRPVSVGPMSGFWGKKDVGELLPTPEKEPVQKPPQSATTWTSEKKLLVANAIVAGLIILLIVTLKLTE